jgi:hypothetical protein
MIFEEQLGIRPSEWLHHPELDAFLSTNSIGTLTLEAFLVGKTGLHLSMLRFVIASLLTVLVGVVHRYIPTATGACCRQLWISPLKARLLSYQQMIFALHLRLSSFSMICMQILSDRSE